MNDTFETPTHRTWPDYRAVWRWHFYAGLICLPFVIVLSISGAIYLFKTEIEAWHDAPYDNLTVNRSAHDPAAHITAAVEAAPGSSFNTYEIPQSERSAIRVVVKQNAASIRTYVHPETLEVLHQTPESERFMRLMFRLHGELLMGERGSLVVELAACWTIILIVTGLYLWWPRQTKGLGGIIYPRLNANARVFWRDLHGVTGVWISTFALLLLLSGLPWAKFWGNYLKSVRRLAGAALVRHDWETNRDDSRKSPITKQDGDHSEHGGRSGARRERKVDTAALQDIGRVVAVAQTQKLVPPVLVSPPNPGSSHWSAKSNTPNRPLRVNLVIDGKTGDIISREGFEDRPLIDKVVAVGIAAHEGRLFGWPNQLLGLITAAGLVLLSVSGVIMWWRRRARGLLGAPKPGLSPTISFSLIILLVLFGLYLPLFGISLVSVLLLEKLVLSRVPFLRAWLGLRPSAREEASNT